MTQFTELTADIRSHDTRQTSDIAAAVSVVDAFASRSGAGVWPALDRADIADRLREIVQNPRLIDQGGLNLCGPAALAVMWGSRDPVALATFACQIFETGHSSIGSLHISPHSDILKADPATMPTQTRAADWMLLGAIRNSEDAFWQGSWRGDPSQQLSGMTLPETLARWFRESGTYAHVAEEGNWILEAGLEHAIHLPVQAGTDVALLINANMLSAARVLNAIPPEKQPSSNWLLDMFPNHYVVALNVPTVATEDDPELGAVAGDVVLSVWTWGANRIDMVVPQHDFVRNYFGAVIAHLP